MFQRSLRDPVILVIALLAGFPASGAMADFHGDGATDSAWTGEFPPEDYNPYLPEGQRPAQQLVVPLQSPVLRQAPLSPRLARPPVIAPTPLYPGLYSPQALPLPGVSPYAPGYYAPDPGLYPGYFYPFNNNQFVAPFF